jgi:outer membrane protein TolC
MIFLLLEKNFDILQKKIDIDMTVRRVWLQRLSCFLGNRISVGLQSSSVLEKKNNRIAQEDTPAPVFQIEFANLVRNFQDLFNESNLSDAETKTAFYKFLNESLDYIVRFMRENLQQYFVHIKKKKIYEDTLKTCEQNLRHAKAKKASGEIPSYELDKVASDISQAQISIQKINQRIDECAKNILNALGMLPHHDFEFLNPALFQFKEDIDDAVDRLVSKHPTYLFTSYALKIAYDRSSSVWFMPNLSLTLSAPFSGEEWSHPKRPTDHYQVNYGVSLSLFDADKMERNNQDYANHAKSMLERKKILFTLRNEIRAMLTNARKTVSLLRDYNRYIKLTTSSIEAMRQFYKEQALSYSELSAEENKYNEALIQQLDYLFEATFSCYTLILYDSFGGPDEKGYIFDESRAFFQPDYSGAVTEKS